jgi:hypothetical protein
MTGPLSIVLLIFLTLEMLTVPVLLLTELKFREVNQEVTQPANGGHYPLSNSHSPPPACLGLFVKGNFNIWEVLRAMGGPGTKAWGLGLQ